MKYRTLGKTGWRVSEIGFGAWAIGGSWGPVDDEASKRALHAAIDAGVTFIDTADVYGDGRSERLIGQVLRERPGQAIVVATKAGRRLATQTSDGYTRDNLVAWIDRSLANLGVDRIDLLQLHCPHPGVYDRDDVFGWLDECVAAGKIQHYGVSVETVEEARRAIRHPRVSTVQIVYNMFRMKPGDSFLAAAQAADVGVVARVPLASGLLTGRIRPSTAFDPDDHRHFNRHGEAFDKGETFSGVPLDVAMQAVDALRPLVPEGLTMTAFALRWILMCDAVTCAIPGARTMAQARENASASEAPPLSPETMAAVRRIYDERLRALIHDAW